MTKDCVGVCLKGGEGKSKLLTESVGMLLKMQETRASRLESAHLLGSKRSNGEHEEGSVGCE